ncbi:universal stress protein [Arthrobacter tumbae]|uniref:universal stress protein n=1 Tax=Arthrobacter tumbae TaxID=163874 RepID=UPI00195E8277|nr:universal stress protein [Arthrobacter tumbae]MBM7782982.1 nucleotide-binding universal stress UspA family protein [Arthrobacter tumbae]
MSHVHTVLAATDFSPAAVSSVERAALLCRDAGAVLELFHTVNVSDLDRLRRLVPGIPNRLKQPATDDRREEITLLGGGLSELHGVRVGVHVEAGPAFLKIEERAADVSADLVVLGVHGTNTFAHPILGSTAARMVESSAHAVLVVKQEPRERYRNVLVPVDFSEYSLPALMLARTVAPAAGIILMHAYGVPFEGKLKAGRVVEEELAPFLNAARNEVFEDLYELSEAAGLAPRAVRLLACHGTALEQILEQERTRYCDLIVMGHHGEAPLLERVFLGSVTKQVLALSEADVLVVPGP